MDDSKCACQRVCGQGMPTTKQLHGEKAARGESQSDRQAVSRKRKRHRVPAITWH